MKSSLFVWLGLGVALEATAQPVGLPKDTADLSKPFSHDSHLALLVKKGDRLHTCADCHSTKALGHKSAKDSANAPQGAAYPICESPRMPYPSHDKCIGCHPSSFFVKPLVICTNCHTDISITKQSSLKEQTGTRAPLRTEFDHSLHLNPKQRVKNQFGFNKDCTFCHAFVKGGESVSLPAHAQCCECHTKQDVKPNINDCAGCHVRPASEPNPASMVRKFKHADHKTDPATGASLECLRCHQDVTRSKKVATLQLPKMATCVECHQGELAFSYGDCLKCHDAGIETRLVPETHKKALPKK